MSHPIAPASPGIPSLWAASACFLALLAVSGMTGTHLIPLLSAFLLVLALSCRRRGVGERQHHCPALFPGSSDHPAPREAPGAALTSPYPGDGLHPIVFHNGRERRFATATGGRLVIGAGMVRGVVGMELCSGLAARDGMDTIACRLQVADATGQTWECRQIMLPFLLTDPVEPGAVLPPDGFFFCTEAPTPWQEALAGSCLVTGVHNLLDTGDRGQLTISGITHQISFRRQKLRADVAYLESGATFIVRISQLIHDIHVHGNAVGSAALPPFCYAVPAEELLFLASPHHYYSYHEEWYAMEEGEMKKAPLFTGLHRKDTPQALVHLAR